MFRSYGLAASIIKYINPYAKRFMVDPECRGFFFFGVYGCYLMSSLSYYELLNFKISTNIVQDKQ